MTQIQGKIPLLDALIECGSLYHAPFYAPGHKRGVGISDRLTAAFGSAVFALDLPELPQLDNLFAPAGVILEAQELASETFGSARTWFLVNGSTCGIIAAILGTCAPGDKIIIPRNVHYSVVSGLILSGAIPIFIQPEYDAKLDLAHSITPEAVKQALEAHPNAKAVLMVYPTYFGACGDIEAIAELTHGYRIPLLVDEAHGAHFAFHPDLPISALAAGADLTVQSTHKVLGAVSQASMLHLRGNRVDPDRISQALQLVQSTSPNALLLASLDAARHQMATQGEELLSRTLTLAAIAQNQISSLPSLSILKPSYTPGFTALDPTRLTVRVAELGITGFEADEMLIDQGVIAELPSLQHLTFIISLGNTQTDIDLLGHRFSIIQNSTPNKLITQEPLTFLNIPIKSEMSPREAYFSQTERVTREEARDRLSSELICPYPPGIPLLMPGEVITLEALNYLDSVLASGGTITGCSDPLLKSFKVVKR
ncbi:aminotransferase class I/II-fold pyridoxal phosphate-dependent enzyme [Merismopedia glauca]|uniref:Arginine decarboxylase n=1 Tax=Merismopedia glauca CCAP 1448/3 TaxID=1296344 RepID=A0A2T1C8U6_9CYAN|nr:aminotransferase class I/II-fold pyridoxal phosphate-dependent enzyme [Merismopedia glauca]PSB04676.1 arginine decarboxylase [Merismopedia glauca CCAP 1448/3]